MSHFLFVPLMLIWVFLYLFLIPSTFFFFFWMSNSLNLDQLTLSYRCINRPPLNMTKSSQVTLSHLFISRNYPYLFKWISSFQILSFSLFSLIHINILILVTLILWICCFLTAQHSIQQLTYIAICSFYNKKISCTCCPSLTT